MQCIVTETYYKLQSAPVHSLETVWHAENVGTHITVEKNSDFSVIQMHKLPSARIGGS